MAITGSSHHHQSTLTTDPETCLVYLLRILGALSFNARARHARRGHQSGSQKQTVAAPSIPQVRHSIWADRDSMGTAPGTDRDKDTHMPVAGAVPVRIAVRVRTAVGTVQGAPLEARHSG